MSRFAPFEFAVTFTFTLCIMTVITRDARADDFSLQLRYQTESSLDSGRFHILTREEKWKPEETAIVVCDVWDLHHCLNAVRRLEQFAPRLNEVLTEARKRGATIIHSPSDCMPAYKKHPARQRAIVTPVAKRVPHEVGTWCSIVPAENRGTWPIDQSDGGEDDDPKEHADWVAKLKKMGRNPDTPWGKQSDLILIDAERDFITDRGDEVWNILEARGIRNVILTGVHTNMCVIGRSFGLRQMARNGKNVVLMRDMTDTMYNPKRWPYVSHFTGTDLIVSHIERFVSPTITSDQIIDGQPFRFKGDKRRHIVIIAAEGKYETNRTLPEFAVKHLGHHFQVTMLFGNDHERHSIPGFEAVDDADVLLISIRRRWLLAEDMARIRKFVKDGQTLIGIRTASHAFSVRNKSTPEGFADWTSFDAEVFGGNYHGHYGNKLKSTIRATGDSRHPILTGFTREPFPQGGSLYQTSPLGKGTTVLLTGSVEGNPHEPVAWTFERADGGRSFYTSMGNRDDFAHPEFQKLLLNGIHWAAGLSISKNNLVSPKDNYREHWSPITVPSSWEVGAGDALKNYDGIGWYRCTVRVPANWLGETPLMFDVDGMDDGISGWFNGQPMRRGGPIPNGQTRTLSIDPKHVNADDANLLAVRIEDRGGEGGLRKAPSSS